MASSKPLLLLSSLLLLALISSVSAASKNRPGPLGGYLPIQDVKDPYVVQIAKFAVSKHNEDASDDLVFIKVLSGQKQVVSGTNFNLIIDARHGDNGAAGRYQALVYDKPWMKIRSLTSFDKA